MARYRAVVEYLRRGFAGGEQHARRLHRIAVGLYLARYGGEHSADVAAFAF